ncbi:MAG: hypothetical protein B6I26_03555 [Desulfobacteraceae bacterium 4572_130]|nr:MAG: hypothetical protein B6I26_03555 [Desulfobacteraceae bacterium 4572_130]
MKNNGILRGKKLIIGEVILKNYNKNNIVIKKIKIAIVSPNYGLIGGAEHFAFELTERLAKMHNFDIHVFANKWRKGKANIIFHKVPIIKFPRWAKPLSFAWFAQKMIRTEKFDIIHSHERLFNYDFLTHHGVPHKIWIKEIRKKRLSLFDRALANIERIGITSMQRPHILPVSTITKKYILKQFNISDPIMTVINPGITVKKFAGTKAKEHKNKIRNNYGLTDNDIVILFVGMNFDIKGLGRLLKSIAIFTNHGKKHLSLKLLVLGKGNKKKYLDIACDLKISDRVIFAGVSRNIEEYYPASDVFVLPSYLDAFGIVVLEAMASGLPVIISDGAGASDVVEHGITGYIIKNKNFEQEIIPLLFTLLDKEKRQKIGENAKLVAANYDWDIIAEKMAKLYMQRMKI